MQASASLGEPDGLPLVEAVRWIEGVLAGPAATAVAVVAVGAFGALMLAGRIDLARGARIVLGCFVVFGAAAMAAGLMQFGRLAGVDASPLPGPEAPATFAAPPAPLPPSPPAAMTDPYAGASLPPKR